MHQVWFYTIISVIIVSLISFIGIITISIKQERLEKILIYLVSFTTGALFGGAFIHLIPEAAKSGFTIQVSISILLGILIFFLVEKFIHWRHCHIPTSKKHVHNLSIMNLVGDGFHNFLDGLIIGASYLASIPIGIATTLAVIFHEIPQEIGDFGVLLYGGFSRKKALFLNFLTALTAVLGAIIALVIGSYIDSIILFLVPFAAGGFIYIAGSDLLPELHKKFTVRGSIIQLIMFVLGIVIMFLLTLME